jgi:hypothetical protein
MMRTRRRAWLGLILGLTITSMSLSTGFIWACGSACVTDPALWTPDRQPLLVFAAALTAWWGYLFAHVAWTGTLVDQSAHNEEVEYEIESNLGMRVQQLGVVLGVSILVCGMVIGVVYIRNGNHLLTNLGGILFLGGFVIAHFMETGEPL